LHEASLSVKNEFESARNHQPCQNPVSLYHVIPRLKPGGRKNLPHGLQAQGTNLLFRHFDSLTDKRKLLIYFQRTFIISNIQGTINRIKDLHDSFILAFQFRAETEKTKPE